MTEAPTSDGKTEIRIGVAAHICDASPNPPARRYRADMTTEQRKSPENGIWLCQDCAKLIDSDDPVFTEALLQGWKAQHAEDLRRSIAEKVEFRPTMPPTAQELGSMLRRAANADLGGFRRTKKWPLTDVSLKLMANGQKEPVTTCEVGKELIGMGDIVIAAPAGTGKTSALFQLAEACGSDFNGIPLVVSLPDWSTSQATLLQDVLRRPAYEGFDETHLRVVGKQLGIVFLLDSWNELDRQCRRRARVEIERLRADLPKAIFVITTRPDISDVPSDGQVLTLLELSREQQLEIARKLRGDDGENVMSEAWQTPGVRDLVAIPLYLTSLLSLPAGQPFPSTKEEVLRRFVEAHERQVQHAEPLREIARGLHSEFLGGLATTATDAANTSISDSNARLSVVRTDDILIEDGLITIRLEPLTVLDALVSHHVLVRAAEPDRYQFQHQQIQEWYASRRVESAMLDAANDAARLKALKTDILAVAEWKEPVLFAVERMARGDERHVSACRVAMLAAREVNPTLAIVMAHRATAELRLQMTADPA